VLSRCREQGVLSDFPLLIDNPTKLLPGGPARASFPCRLRRSLFRDTGSMQDGGEIGIPLVAGPLIERALRSGQRNFGGPGLRPRLWIFHRESVNDGIRGDAREAFR
jgi:hypothetical protein